VKRRLGSVKCLGLSCLGCRLTGLVSEISGKSTHVQSVDWLNLLWAGLFDTGSASGTLIPLVPVKQRAVWFLFSVCWRLCFIVYAVSYGFDTLVCLS
jgi:hypothetical protein